MKNFLLTTLACGLLTTVALPEAVLAQSEGVIPAARAQGSGEPPIITINTEYGASLSFLETDEVIAKAWLGNPNAVEVGFDSQFGQAKVMFLKQEARSRKLDGTSLTVITQDPQGQTQLYSFLLEFKSGKPEQSIWVVRNQIIDVDPVQRAFKTQEQQQLEREQQERAERERVKAQERAQRELAKKQERAQREQAKAQQRAAREQAQREREAQAQERKRLEQEKQALAKEREAQDRERRRLERERQELAQERERESQKLAQEKQRESQRQARLEQEANEREQRAREQERQRLAREQQLAREKEAQRQAQLEQEARERELAIAEEQRSQRQLATTETTQSQDVGPELLVATKGSPPSKPSVKTSPRAPEEPQTVATRQVEGEVTSIDKAHALRRGLIIARTKGEIDYNTRRQSAYSRMQTLIGLLFQGDEWDTAVQKAGIPAKFARDILEYGLN